MLKCDNCGKELDRHVFCSGACKVKFFRDKRDNKEFKEYKQIPVKINHFKTIYYSNTKKPGYHYVSYLGKYVKDKD